MLNEIAHNRHSNFHITSRSHLDSVIIFVSIHQFVCCCTWSLLFMEWKGKGKGGIRQQLGVKKKEKDRSHSVLTNYLVSSYSKGRLAASEVGNVAKAASSFSSSSQCAVLTLLAKVAKATPAKGTNHSSGSVKKHLRICSIMFA